MRIHIDDDVLAALTKQRQDDETPNGTIRRLLGLAPGTRAPRPNEYGALRGLLDAGLVQPGQPVSWPRPRLGIIHTATIDDHGYLDIGGGKRCISPVEAATAVAGYPGSSWSVWRTADGTTLQQLRQRAQLAAVPSEHRRTEPSGWTGALHALVQAGLLQPGQHLTSLSGMSTVCRVTVDSDGLLRTADGQRFATPGRALALVSGTKGNGWHAWRTEHGTSLYQLRAQLHARNHTPPQ
ncbi:hypothetical protein AB0B31_11005 [Catellatospora citrea]|uniref:restriction system modified-DNA reader domain-containing protein n=1 Tax=Catellatospora citrea TaxID=53366 RepID=UPI003409943D